MEKLGGRKIDENITGIILEYSQLKRGEGWVRETTSTRFSPSTMWDPGIEPGFSGLEAGSLPLSQLIAPPVR